MREEFTRHGQTWDIWFPEEEGWEPEIQKQLKVGDSVWYIARTQNGYVVVKCKIVEVEKCFRQKESDAYVFYDLDEPIGHSVAYDEVFLNSTLAKRAMRDYYAEALFNKDESGLGLDATLESYRKTLMGFIAHTWEVDGGAHPGFAPYPDKKEGQDWFNMGMILTDKEKEVHSLGQPPT